jgi:hypothetical protein
MINSPLITGLLPSTYREIVGKVPADLRQTLAEIYQSSPHEWMMGVLPQHFVDGLATRIYHEWKNDPDPRKPATYDEEFTRYIDNEVLYAMKRLEGDLKNGAHSSLTEREIRGRVLQAVVRRGIDLFSDWGRDSVLAPANDTRNLRISLESSLGF